MPSAAAHPENPVLQADHVAAMALVAADQATHVAEASGFGHPRARGKTEGFRIREVVF